MGEKKRRQVARSGDPSIEPVSTEILVTIAKARELVQRGLMNEAATLLSGILSISPNQFAASYISGDIELWRKKYEQARIHYEHALLSDPHSIPLKINLGAALYGLGLHDEAIKNYDHVLHLQPNHAMAWFNRGLSLLERYEFEAARIAFDKVLALDPQFTQFEVAHVARCMAELPVIYDTQKDIAERRKAYEGQLRRLCERPNAFKGGIGASQPFYLAYQGENDRDLQALYGAAVCKQARVQYPDAELAAPPLFGEPIRVGIVSGYFRNPRKLEDADQRLGFPAQSRAIPSLWILCRNFGRRGNR